MDINTPRRQAVNEGRARLRPKRALMRALKETRCAELLLTFNISRCFPVSGAMGCRKQGVLTLSPLKFRFAARAGAILARQRVRNVHRRARWTVLHDWTRGFSGDLQVVRGDCETFFRRCA